MKKHSSSECAAYRMEQMVSKLREREFRITPQRMAVLRVLAASEGHYSVQAVYEIVRREFPTTGIATIYKTVNLLKNLNEVLEIAVPVRKPLYSLSLWGRAGVGVNDIRRLSFPPPAPPRGRGVSGQALAIPGGSKWYDGHKPIANPHVICTGCKKVIDLDIGIGSLKDITKKVADKTGFDILSYRLDFLGLCSDCKKK